MAHLSTHVLDTSRGVPAAGMVVEVHAVGGAGRRPLARTTTNAEGRTEAPLVPAGALEPGIYEITFHAADYFRRAGVALADPPFLDAITIRIGIADPGGRYHVPLLLSPYGYSTYRGT